MQVAKAVFLIGTSRLLTLPDSLLVLWYSRCILRLLGPWIRYLMRWGPEPSVGAAARDRGRESLKTRQPIMRYVLHLQFLAVSNLHNLSASKRWVDNEELERFR